MPSYEKSLSNTLRTKIWCSPLFDEFRLNSHHSLLGDKASISFAQHVNLDFDAYVRQQNLFIWPRLEFSKEKVPGFCDFQRKKTLVWTIKHQIKIDILWSATVETFIEINAPFFAFRLVWIICFAYIKKLFYFFNIFIFCNF